MDGWTETDSQRSAHLEELDHWAWLLTAAVKEAGGSS